MSRSRCLVVGTVEKLLAQTLKKWQVGLDELALKSEKWRRE